MLQSLYNWWNNFWHYSGMQQIAVQDKVSKNTASHYFARETEVRDCSIEQMLKKIYTAELNDNGTSRAKKISIEDRQFLDLMERDCSKEGNHYNPPLWKKVVLWSCKQRRICDTCGVKHPTGSHGYKGIKKNEDGDGGNSQKSDRTLAWATTKLKSNFVNMWVVPVKVKCSNSKKKISKYKAGVLFLSCTSEVSLG